YRVQWKRINDAKLDTHFKAGNRLIVPHKGAEQMEFVCQRYPQYSRDQIWMVGDSLRSDIEPAIASGMNAILIDGAYCSAAGYFGVTAQPLDEAKFTRVTSLTSAAMIILHVAELHAHVA
ncbi:MAG: family hydrolase, partial [Firmicutes bacterium]|nr:family hydrolase [Bacillota bacterium]